MRKQEKRDDIKNGIGDTNVIHSVIKSLLEKL